MKIEKYKISFLVTVLSGFISVGMAQAPFSKNYTIWYDKPAEIWEEALPIGNGRLGAMCFGGIHEEKLQLNDVTIWSGEPQPNSDRTDAYKKLPEIREALRNRDYKLAEVLTHQYMTCNSVSNEDIYNTIYSSSYQTLGDLSLKFKLPEGEMGSYRRWLDITRAISGVDFKIGEYSFSREIFSSAPDSVIVMKLGTDMKGGLSFSMLLDRKFSAVTTSDSHGLVMKGNTDYMEHRGNCDYEARVKVVADGGRVSNSKGKISVQGADSAYVYITCQTSYILDYKKNYRRAIDSKDAVRKLNIVSRKKYDDVKSIHVADYQGIFNRLSLNLGNNKSIDIPTDQRLTRFNEKSDDLGFVDLFYQFGRYLMISSSRENNPLPGNCQGIWGDGYKLPWHSDYKANINYQMNYWMVEASNLSECHIPMLRLTASLVEPGRKTAQSYFNASGWMYAMMTNAWGWTSPGQYTIWGSFFGGSGWACQDFWEHYAYTQDKEYLRKVYPILKEACEFYLSVLIENKDGYLVTSPSTSPENRYIAPDGSRVAVTEGSTIELSIIRNLFSNTIYATGILNEDNSFKEILEKSLARLRPLQIGRAGQLMEWNDDFDLNAEDIRHRHVSHLFSLHPGREIIPFEHKELAEAAKRSLQIRGDEGTGWSLAWKINFWARLLEGDYAYKLLCRQLKLVRSNDTNYSNQGGTYPNLFDAHPPFQIDGNYGFVSGVNEMLLQSHEMYIDPSSPNEDLYVIRILPALPQKIREGKISGIRARGGFELSFEWKDGRLVNAVITSLAGKQARVFYQEKEISLNIAKGETKELNELCKN